MKKCTKIKVLKSQKLIKKWWKGDMAWVPHGFTTLFKVIIQTFQVVKDFKGKWHEVLDSQKRGGKWDWGGPLSTQKKFIIKLNHGTLYP